MNRQKFRSNWFSPLLISTLILPSLASLADEDKPSHLCVGEQSIGFCVENGAWTNCAFDLDEVF